MAVYCTFSAEVPDDLLEALAMDLKGMMQVWEVWEGCGSGGGGP